MTAKKTIRTPTEDTPETNLRDFFNATWGEFKSEYLPFVEWIRENDYQFVLIQFLDNEPPESYTNKWNRDQYKKEVRQDDEAKILSGGKRLWGAIRDYCVKNKILLDKGLFMIQRHGSGFDTNYTVSHT